MKQKSFLRAYWGFLLALVPIVVFAADVAISGLTAGSAIVGTEPIPTVQGGVTVKTTPSAIRTYMLGTASTWTAAQTLASPVLNSPTINTPTFTALGAISPTSISTATVTSSTQFFGRGTLDNSAPAYSFTGDTDTGWGWRAGNIISGISGGAEFFRVFTNGTSILNATLQIGGATRGMVFNSADNLGGSDDAGVARNAAAKVEVNTGTKGTLADFAFRQLYPDFTNTSTVGAVTINKSAGKAIVGLGTASTVVTNSLVTANSQVICTINSNDATAILKNCTPTAGSFTITTTANATADTNVAFLVLNQ